MNKMSFTIGFTTLMEFSDSKSLTYFAAAQDAQGFPKKPITSVKVATGISSIIWKFQGATIRLSSVVNHPFWVNK